MISRKRQKTKSMPYIIFAVFNVVSSGLDVLDLLRGRGVVSQDVC